MRTFVAALAAALWLPLSAEAARRNADKSTVEPPAPWEQPGGRDQARLELARALLTAGSPDACLELIAQLRRDGVKGLELERLHAQALRSTGLDDDARAILEGIVQRWPRDASAHNELGILAMDRNDVEAAVDHFKQAVRHDDGNGGYLNNLGFALMVAERPDEAIDILRSALRADSSKAQTRNNLGFALVAAGRESEAWRVFKAATKSPADAHYNVGVGLEIRGASSEATEAYRKALDTDPSHEKAQDALVRLTTASDPNAPQGAAPPGYDTLTNPPPRSEP